MKMMEEYCKVITQMTECLYCSQTDSSVGEFGFLLGSLLRGYILCLVEWKMGFFPPIYLVICFGLWPVEQYLFCSTFVTISFLLCGVVSPEPNPQPGGPGYPFLSGSPPLTCLAWEALPVAYATASIALRIMWLQAPQLSQSRDTPKVSLLWRSGGTCVVTWSWELCWR